MPFRPLRAAFALLLALASSPLCRAETPALMANARLTVLPNGLRLIVREQHASPLVAIDIWVRAGSAHEAPGESGAAHFLEHCLFKGTATRKPGDIDGAIEDLGASLSATTTRDAMRLYTTVPSAYWESALGVMTDALRNAALRPDDVERERSVIVDEVARSRNDLRKEAVSRLSRQLYPNCAYGRPIIGELASLRTLSRDAVAGYYHRLYSPAAATLVLVGDVTPSAAEAAAVRLLGDWARGTAAPAAVPAPAPQTTPMKLPEPGPSECVVAFGYRTCAPDATDWCATAEVAAAMLGTQNVGLVARGAASRLIVGSSECVAYDLRGDGMFVVSLLTQAQKAAQAREVLRAAVAALAQGAFSEDDLALGRRTVIGGYLFDTETFGGQAMALGYHDVHHDYTDALTLMDRVQRVTAMDVMRFAGKYMSAPGAEACVVPEQVEEANAR